MKPTFLARIAAGALFLFPTVTAAPAAISMFVDMDTITPGIQSSISVLPATVFSVDLWVSVDPLRLSSFSVSAMYDTTELAFMPPTFQPPMPGGLAPIAAPDETMAPMGIIKSINGGTFGPGPASISFVFGTLTFTAHTPMSGASSDVVLGYFNLPGIIDDAFDSMGMPLMPTTMFASGKVDLIPEPGRPVLLVLGVLGTLLATRRRR